MRSIYNYFIILFFIAAFTSCKKSFLDVNVDPNQVTEANITPELIYPQAANNVGILAASANIRFLNQWVGYWAFAGDFASPGDEISYHIDNTYTENLWDFSSHSLFDLYLVKTKAYAKKDSVETAAAMILSAKVWQEMVDMFGDIPYSQAFQSDKYPNPKFDKAKDIYGSLQLSLDTAITYMKLGSSDIFASIDIVNHGDQTRWIKFANTLKLRLLIRQSEVPGFDPSTEVAKILANGGVLHAGENVNVNPGYSNTVNKQNPYYTNYGLTPTGSTANTFSFANVYTINILKSTNDPRLSRFFLPNSGGVFAGSVYGLTAGNPNGAQLSNIGPGLANNAAQDQWIYPAFESMFLEAEAIARGWMPGDAQTAYEAAVTENFVWLGVPDAVNAAQTYLSNNSIAKWSTVANADVETKARFIAYQKYIALIGIDPLEAWSDIRRLNMLTDNSYISVSPSRLANHIPYRLPYAQSEYTSNSASVSAEGTIDILTSKIFWQP